jgi:hypothetical protein|tara:strand:- start:61 stop:765 length:705 start_codon:yes stop_codon:yes gene_type:complete
MLIKVLKKFASFFSDKLKLKIQPKTPVDLYIESISENCYQMFKKDFEKSFVFSDDDSIRSFAINEAIKKFDKKKLFLEFGVYKGDSINLFGKYLKKINTNIYGFDSFTGLKDEWITDVFNPKATFDVKSKKPKVHSNVKLIKGWVEDTLEEFLTEHKEKEIAFVHLDMDTYESTSFVLEKIKKKLLPGSIILFDEFYGFPNWEKYEYKALIEKLKKDNFKYIAFANRQACIKII